MAQSFRDRAGDRLHATALTRPRRRADRGRRPRQRGDALAAAAAVRLRPCRALGTPPRRPDGSHRRTRPSPAKDPRPHPGQGAVDGVGLHRPRRGPGPVRPHLEPQPRTPAHIGKRRRRAARHPDLLERMVSQRHPGNRALPRCHQPLPAHPQSADLPTHRGNLRRSHHLAARADRRPPKLGLPLLLAARLHYTLQALISAGYLTEAKAWREWLLRAVAGDPADLQIMYALDGTRRLPETELPWLAS